MCLPMRLPAHVFFTMMKFTIMKGHRNFYNLVKCSGTYTARLKFRSGKQTDMVYELNIAKTNGYQHPPKSYMPGQDAVLFPTVSGQVNSIDSTSVSSLVTDLQCLPLSVVVTSTKAEKRDLLLMTNHMLHFLLITNHMARLLSYSGETF